MLARSSLAPAPALAEELDAIPSFEAIFDEHARFVWRALRRLGVDEADVEDVCQEAFLIAHRRLPSFEGRSSIRTWIYGICVRVAADYRKRPHRRREVVVEAPPDQAMAAPQMAALEEHRARALLDRALDGLDADKRAVFVLFELEDLSMNEVAETVGCPLQTAYARLYAARKQVEAALRRATAEKVRA
jgi:RNA polymerase sigma-70 factor (ECF subfamily)